ncbi:MAG: hypothetical protein HY769_08465 [Candidatus Stahlbacteria bacterium]|nr:hypothetical protein [Candidatus Stahlbacteria bacterium]
MSTALEKIRKEVQLLTLQEQLRLIENLIHQLRDTTLISEKLLDLNGLYGLGKGLWEEDAQEYVNQIRENRI